MLKEPEDREDVEWMLEIGLYPGICIGIRSYIEEDFSRHVLYLPFIDLCLTIYK